MLVHADKRSTSLGWYDEQSQSSSSFDVRNLPKCAPLECPEENSTEQIETPKVKKSVRFNGIVKYRKIPSVFDMPHDMKKQLWIAKHELRRIKLSCRELVDQMDAGEEDIDPDILQDRGLEQFRQSQQQKRKTSRLQAYREVLFMQEFQYDLFDLYRSRGDISSLIAARYSNYCADSQVEALRRGEEDARAILPRAA